MKYALRFSLQRLNINSFYAALVTAMFFGVVVTLSLFVQSAHAQSGTVSLSVSGGGSVSIINGQPVTLEWEIDAPVSSCTINNGVGSIDVSSIPAVDSLEVFPPENTETRYTLNCDGITDAAVVTIAPIVTMSIDGGTTQTNHPTRNRIERLRVRWDAQYANRCDRVWHEYADSPGVKDYAWQSNYYTNRFQPSGSVDYRGYPHGYINKTATFYIVCHNDVTGASATGSVTLLVNDPPPPEAPIINLDVPRDTVFRNELYGYANANVSFTSSGVRWCVYDAFDTDGNSLDSLPIGFGEWGGHTSRNFTVRLATTTTLEIKCSRSELTIAGVTYPATSTTARGTVVVGVDDIELDRSVLPPVTANIGVTQNPVQAHPLSREAYVVATTSAREADFCYRYANRYDPATGDYTDRYTVHGWTRESSHQRQTGNGDRTVDFYLATTTRLEMWCLRQFDNALGSGFVYNRGTERVFFDVVVNPPTVAVPPPTAYIYGNAQHYDAEELANISSDSDLVLRESGTANERLQSPMNGDGITSSITFPFTHPQGSADLYNIHLSVCDQTDAVSTFNVYTESDGLVGFWNTNSPLAVFDETPGEVFDDCMSSSRDWTNVLVASGVDLADGDEITIECTQGDGENCQIKSVSFGAGDGGTVAIDADDVSPTTGFATVPILRVGEFADRCVPLPAETANASYDWDFSRSPLRLTNEIISTSTQFSVRCENDASGSSNESEVNIQLPFAVSLDAETSIFTGDCTDPDTGLTIEAPDGFGPGPGPDFFCTPLVDLGANTLDVLDGTPDNISGTYDDFGARIAIQNFGPGALAAGADISYVSSLTMPDHPLLTDLESSVGYFDSGLSAPIDPSTPTDSNPLTRTFDDVPFGSHQLCTRVNSDNPGGDYPENDTTFTNNTSCTVVDVPVPPPPMSLSVDRDVIRSGERAALNWSVNVTYELECTVQGAGGLDTSFNTSGFSNPYEDSFNTNPLSSTSDFVFTCTEPITGTVFSRSARVEVVPTFQEI